MKKIILILSLLLIGLLTITGCENPSDPEQFDPRIVLDAYLSIGDTVAANLSWSQSVMDVYDPLVTAIPDARVIAYIDNVPDTLQYRFESRPTYTIIHGDTVRDTLRYSRYYSRTQIVHSTTSYRLVATLPDGRAAYGETRSPSPFRMISDSTTVRSGDTISFGHGYGARMKLKWQPDALAQQYWLVAVCHDTTAPKLRTESGMGHGEDPDRTSYWTQDASDAFVPWFFFNYTGWHTVLVYNIDQAFKRYLWTLNRNLDQADKTEMNVVGGLGVVTAFGCDSVRVFIKP